MASLSHSSDQPQSGGNSGPADAARAGFYLPGSSAGSGGRIGVLMLHGFLGSAASIQPWALGVNRSGFTVSAPTLAGHQSSWQELNTTTWSDWYASAEAAFLELKKNCDRIFVAGFSMGGALALKLAEIRGSEIEGLILLNPSVGDKRVAFKILPVVKHFISSVKNGRSDIAKPGAPLHIFPRTPLKALDSLRVLWREVTKDLYLVDIPLMIAYSAQDHTVDPYWSEYVLENVYSPTVREITFDKSFHNVALDFDADELIMETVDFIHDVLTGELERIAQEESGEIEEELIRAEFESIVSGLNLDQSTESTYLDELDQRSDNFTPPNPPIAPTDQLGKWAIAGLVGGPAYIFLAYLTGFDLFGFGIWPGVLGFIAGVVTALYKFTKPDDEPDPFDDGAIL